MWQRLKAATPRWVALVAIGAVALGSYAIAPAIGGPGGLSTKQAKRLFLTKRQAHARFYTKGQADFRYFTRNVANARFVPRQSGEHSVTLDPYDWSGPGGPGSEVGFARFTGPGSGVALRLHDGSLPHRFAGKGLRLTAVELCFELVDATIASLVVTRSGPVGSGDPVGPAVPFIDDSTPLSEDECHRYDPPVAAPVGGAAVLDLELTVDFATSAGRIDIGRTAAIFVP